MYALTVIDEELIPFVTYNFNLRFDFFCLFFFLYYLLQVIKSFGLPEFFNLVFPLLFDMCNLAALNKSGQVPLASDAAKTGYIQIFSPI